MRFWLRKGVDGFRVDVIWHLIKDAQFRDNPPNPHFRRGRPPHEEILTQYSTDQPEVHEVVAEMRRVIDEFDDRVLIGEIYLPVRTPGRLLRQRSLPAPDAVQLRACVDAVERAVDRKHHRRLRSAFPWGPGRTGCSAITIGRGSRAGSGRQARVAAMLLLTLRGTPTLYYGDEIGMQSGRHRTRSGAGSFREERAGDRRRPRRLPHADAMGRAEAHAGFSSGEPWLPLAGLRPRECRQSRWPMRHSILQPLQGADRNHGKQLPQLVAGATCRSRRRAISCSIAGKAQGTARHHRAQSRRRARLRLRRTLNRLWRRNPALDTAGSRGESVSRTARSARQ